AEDGIRDRNVTGVQTCALPIFSARKIDVISAAMHGLDLRERKIIEDYGVELAPTHTPPQLKKALAAAVIAADPSKAKERHEKERSEERRVGKGGRAATAREQEK